MFGTERRCAIAGAGRPRFNDLRRGLVLVRRMYITIAASCKEFYKGHKTTQPQEGTESTREKKIDLQGAFEVCVFVVKNPR